MGFVLKGSRRNRVVKDGRDLQEQVATGFGDWKGPGLAKAGR